MSEEVKEPQSEEVEKEQPQVEEPVVTLTAEQYGAILDKLADMEEKRSKPTHQVVSLEELAREGRRTLPQVEEQPKGGLDDMSNRERELVNFIVDEINRQATPLLQDLATKLETQRVLREIDKCEAKYDDFWDYRERILQIGSENPNLSVEAAYKLAKSEKGEQPIKPKGDSKSILHHLPPRPTASEKAGPARAVTSGTGVKSLKEAAEKAWGEVVKE